MEPIFENGLIKKQRQYVYLSSDIETAIVIGKRYGEPVILEMNSASMFNKGIKLLKPYFL